MYENNVMNKPFPVNLYEAITGTSDMPVDGSGTLFYLLEFIAPKNKLLLLQRFKEGFSYRKIGVLNEISGARAEAVISDTVKSMRASKEMLINGIAKTINDASLKCNDIARKKMEAECREKYTSEGYQMGYIDGIAKREKAMYSYGKYDNITIDDLDLSNRSYTAMQKNGIYTVSDIIHIGNGLFDIENLGKKSLIEIITKLHEIGVDVSKHFKRIILKYEIFFAET